MALSREPLNETLTKSPGKPLRDLCPLTDWGCMSAPQRHSWKLLSRHPTSEGGVEYCRCTCGGMAILYEGALVAYTKPHPG